MCVQALLSTVASAINRRMVYSQSDTGSSKNHFRLKAERFVVVTTSDKIIACLSKGRSISTDLFFHSSRVTLSFRGGCVVSDGVVTLVLFCPFLPRIAVGGFFCPKMTLSCRKSCASSFFHLVGELTLEDGKKDRVVAKKQQSREDAESSSSAAASSSSSPDDPAYWTHYAHALWVLLETKTADFLPADAVPSYKWSSAKSCSSYTRCIALSQTIRAEALGLEVLLTATTAPDAKPGKKKKTTKTNKKEEEKSGTPSRTVAKGGEREAPNSFQLLVLQVALQLREDMTTGGDDEIDDDS